MRTMLTVNSSHDPENITINSSLKYCCDELTMWRVDWLPTICTTCVLSCLLNNVKQHHRRCDQSGHLVSGGHSCGVYRYLKYIHIPVSLSIQVQMLMQYGPATSDWLRSGIQRRIQNRKKLFWSALVHCCKMVAVCYFIWLQWALLSF